MILLILAHTTQSGSGPPRSERGKRKEVVIGQRTRIRMVETTATGTMGRDYGLEGEVSTDGANSLAGETFH